MKPSPLALLRRLSVAALPFTATFPALAIDDAARERLVRAHVTFLADDLLEGRAAASRGHELAMAYVCAQFQRLGLEPAGENGYRQPLALRESHLNREAGRLVLHQPGGDVSLVMINEAMARPASGVAAAEVRAPAVFVGFGISAPEFGYDDFANGTDVRGKIAVLLNGTPAKLPATARAHYSRERTAGLARRGAVGIVTLETPEAERRTPWAVTVSRDRFPAMRLMLRDGTLFDAFPEIRAGASVSRAAAAAFFKPASREVAAVFAASERSEPQAFPLGFDVTIAGKAEVGDTSSANVLGWLPGSAPELAGEPLVVTAHLDHLGIGAGGVNGDKIYNGAFDNALGSAVILAIAEELAAGPRLARPVLFAALTAEEKGLQGAHHLARHPPARVRKFVANLNVDMPVLLAPIRDVIGPGAEHSSLGPKLAAAAERQGFTVSPDPQPEEVYFVRSDQYAFIRTGVPAMFLHEGRKGVGGVDLTARRDEFRRTRYHHPSDDLAQPIDWPSAAAFTRLAADLARSIADDREAPRWNPGDFFGTRFGPKNGAPGGTPSGTH